MNPDSNKNVSILPDQTPRSREKESKPPLIKESFPISMMAAMINPQPSGFFES